MSRFQFVVDYWWKLALLTGLLLVCIWPALYNRQPFFFTDTTAYIRGADAGIMKLTGHLSVWSAPPLSASGEQTGSEHSKSLNNLEEKFVISGRSVYYGVLIYIGDLLDHLWPTILLQAAMIVGALALTLSTTAEFDWFALSALTVGLVVTTPMAFYASFLMPDVFAGLAILAVANLVSYGTRIKHSVLIMWVILLCMAVLFHTSHLLMVLALLVVATVWMIVKRTNISWKGIACLAFAVIVGFLGETTFTQGVTKFLGTAPVRFPFVMDRMILDGPGAAYLRANCPQAGFTMCRFLDRLPVNRPSSETERKDADNSMFEFFKAADPDIRRSFSAQQYSFALATLRYDPVGVIVSAVRNTIIQLRSFRLDEFDYGQAQAFFADRIPQPYLVIMERTKAWAGKMQVANFSTLVLLVVVPSTLYVAAFLVWTWRTTGADAFARFVAIVLLGILLNAMICGAISGIYDRFQARVIWLIPLTAALIFYRRRQVQTLKFLTRLEQKTSI